MIAHRHAPAIDDQRALVPLARLVMRESGHARHGAEEEVVPREEVGPGQSHAMPRLVGGQPVAMGNTAANRARVVAVVAEGEGARHIGVHVELGVALPRRGRRAQEADEDTERLVGVDGGARAIVDLHLLAAQKVREPLQPILYLRVHRAFRRLQHHRDLEVAQALCLAGRR